MCPNFFFLNLIFFGFWVSYLKDVLERKEVAFLEVSLGDEPGQALHTGPMAVATCFREWTSRLQSWMLLMETDSQAQPLRVSQGKGHPFNIMDIFSTGRGRRCSHGSRTSSLRGAGSRGGVLCCQGAIPGTPVLPTTINVPRAMWG